VERAEVDTRPALTFAPTVIVDAVTVLITAVAVLILLVLTVAFGALMLPPTVRSVPTVTRPVALIGPATRLPVLSVAAVRLPAIVVFAAVMSP